MVIRRTIVVLCALAALGCREARELEEVLRHEPPRAQYARRLRDAHLHQTALGRDWLAAGDRALGAPVELALPAKESGYFAPDEARAVAYRLRLRRGERLSVAVTTQASEPFTLFVELFEAPRDTTDGPDHLESLDDASGQLEFEARRDGDVILRLQPELLRGGRYTATLQVSGTLAFPVAGRDPRAIKSFFGAQRDGGRRSHHGVDIFARRGTPVLAATDGYISAVSTTTLGGKVVWLRDSRRGQSLYYAHLDSQHVARGARVRTGDTLGFVGNTGNARTTPPHLHFGIYRSGSGPLDPAPFVQLSRPVPPIVADGGLIGAWARTGRIAELRSGPAADAPVVARLARATAVRVHGAAGGWYRVALPAAASGPPVTGYVAARSLEAAEGAVDRARVAARVVRDRPASGAAIIDSVAAAPIAVLARHEDFALVRAPGGRLGWVRLTSARGGGPDAAGAD
jgi:murein DD-endopeptidase MepM/ murein hydrolase activator NlpD